MDPYDIEISGKTFTVVPLDDGTYTIWEGAKRIANLWLDVTAAGICWAAEKITLQFADQIGTKISAHEF